MTKEHPQPCGRIDVDNVLALLERAYKIVDGWNDSIYTDKMSTEYQLGNDIYRAIGRCKQVKPTC